MTTDHDAAVQREAINWRLRMAEAGLEDWIAFTAWLEADPAHAMAYDALEAADLALEMVDPAIIAPLPVAANDDDATLPSRRVFWPYALAASIAALLVVPGWRLLHPVQDMELVATAPGEQRMLNLPEGDRIMLNGGSRLQLDRSRARFARLDSGQAMFRLSPDKGGGFVVAAGDAEIRDIGTSFDVRRDGARIRIEVAQGAVRYDVGDRQVMLGPGQTLDDPGGQAPIVTGRTSADRVGEWEQGRLSYVDAPLEEVAADMTRTMGTGILIDPDLKARRFTGTIRMSGGADDPVRDLSVLLGVRAEHDAAGWRLAPR